MDEGDILRIEEITIDRYETSLSLFEKFSQVCGPICRSTLIDHKEGRITPVPQPGGATYTKKITKEEGQVDFTSESAETIYRKYQAFTPWPGIWTVVAGKRCKILRVGHPEDPVSTGILIPTFSGNIEIFEVQFEGKKPTPATRSLLD